MSFTSHEIGTLAVVILKAKNLPNKRHIGKQAPYCLVTLNGEERRTRVIKRGGQHPEWDDEFRFTIFEDVEAGLVRSVPGSNAPPPLPPKKRGAKKIKGGNFMRLQCYADDARDPDFIGETHVNLTEALTKGETDEWFTLMNRDKYAGEVYVELTFWSNEPRPVSRSSRRQTMPNMNYGGPGSFVPADSSATLSGDRRLSTLPATGSTIDFLPSSLRASGSRPELYAPPYEQRNATPSAEQLTSDFAELGVVDHRSRDSVATLMPSTSIGFRPLPPGSQLYEQGQMEGFSSIYDNAIVPTTSQSHPSLSSSYYATHENGSISTEIPPVRNHGPRYSMPTSSSGFVSISGVPTSSTYAPVSYPPEPSTFGLAHGHSSHSSSQNQPAYGGYSHPRYVTPSSLTTRPPLPPPNATPHRISHSLSASQVPDYHPFQLTPVVREQTVPFSVQSVEYGGPLPPPTPAHSAPPQIYPARTPTTPPPPPEIPSLNSPSSTTGSRPLPHPSQFRRDRRYSMAIPPSSSFPQQVGVGFANNGSFTPAPPVQPHFHRVPSASGHQGLSEPITARPPPLPMPPGNPPPRPVALPQPRHGYHPGQPAFQPLPPPPSMLDIPRHAQAPSSTPSSFRNTPNFRPHSNYGQPLPTPPPVRGGWQ